MADNLTVKQRSYCMSKVKNKNTSLEIIIAEGLVARGYKFKKHLKSLPGKPDIVFTAERLAIFVDGDFWHGFRFPCWEMSLTPFWKNKIRINRARDKKNFHLLRKSGWKVIRVWQHSIKKDITKIIDTLETTILERREQCL